MENKSETIKCPYCGEEISANAKKCKHCKEWLDQSELGVTEPIKMDFTTHEPTFLQKLAQVYWVNPKSWLLKRFQVDGEKISIETMNGSSFSALINECAFSCLPDKYDRNEIRVKSSNQKIHFKEIPYMLSDEEWEKIVTFCKNSDKSNHTGFKVLKAISSIVNELK